jgi:hypothetical protein
VIRSGTLAAFSTSSVSKYGEFYRSSAEAVHFRFDADQIKLDHSMSLYMAQDCRIANQSEMRLAEPL